MNETLMAIGNFTMNVTKSCAEQCAEFHLNIKDTLNTRLYIALIVLTLIMIIKVFVNRYVGDEPPMWYFKMSRYFDMVILMCSLFLFWYLVFF